MISLKLNTNCDRRLLKTGAWSEHEVKNSDPNNPLVTSALSVINEGIFFNKKMIIKATISDDVANGTFLYPTQPLITSTSTYRMLMTALIWVLGQGKTSWRPLFITKGGRRRNNGTN